MSGTVVPMLLRETARREGGEVISAWLRPPVEDKLDAALKHLG
jgi:hypothetical protein